MSRRSLSLLWALLLLVPLACTDRAGESPLGPSDADLGLTDDPGITVMSQNMYLGANIGLLLTASSNEEYLEVFNQIFTSNAGDFGRVRRMADQIVSHSPHLVGLQEVTRYTFYTGGPPIELDYLDALKKTLDYYRLMGWTEFTWDTLRNDLAEVFIAIPGFPAVSYADADAILVRSDVDVIGEPTLFQYGAVETFNVGGVSFPYWRGYLSVDAVVNGQLVRFANTHLEVQSFESTQTAQTEELIAELATARMPVVLVGDFNSAANHDAAEADKTDSYQLLRRAGYADVWLREAHSVGGVTCCQAADLTNSDSELTQRLDLVLVRWGQAGFGGQTAMEVVGEEASDRIEVVDGLWLWPSDHAGVVASLWAAPGRTR